MLPLWQRNGRNSAGLSGKSGSPRLTADLAPVPDTNDEDGQLVVLDARNDPVVAKAMLPELSELRTLEGLSQTARIVQYRETSMREGKNLSRDLAIKISPGAGLS